ncbi:unnamed protein product [Pylaiella littoralis]
MRGGKRRKGRRVPAMVSVALRQVHGWGRQSGPAQWYMYQSRHRANNYFWRRVFEQKLMQVCTNAWLSFRWWLDDVQRKLKAEIDRLEAGGAAERDGTADGLLVGQLKEESKAFEALTKQSRAQWMRALGVHLMSSSRLGNLVRGRRALGNFGPIRTLKQRSADRTPLARLDGQRFTCEAKNCSARLSTKPNRKYTRGKKVGTACRCKVCKKVANGGVAMSHECYNTPAKRKSALESAQTTGRKRPELSGAIRPPENRLDNMCSSAQR